MHFGNAGDSFLPVQYSSAQFDWPSDYFPHHLAQKCDRGITLHYTTLHYNLLRTLRTNPKNRDNSTWSL